MPRRVANKAAKPLFHKLVKLPKTIFIVGSGPNGQEPYYDLVRNIEIPRIGINGTIMYPGMDYVFFSCPTIQSLPWWKEKRDIVPAEERGVKVFTKQFASSAKRKRAGKPGATCKYYWDKTMSKFGKTTSLGNMTQYLLQRYKNITEVIFCGVDMFGINNFYGKTRRKLNHLGQPTGGFTDRVRNIGKLMKFYSSRCDFKSISETKLEVELVDEEYLRSRASEIKQSETPAEDD